jgi:hypothetical protein
LILRVGVSRFELETSALSELRSNQLSYTPGRQCGGRILVGAKLKFKRSVLEFFAFTKSFISHHGLGVA